METHSTLLALCVGNPPWPEPRFNIKMASYQYRKSHCWDKTVIRSSYLHNGISYTGKMTSLYWIRDQWFSTQTGCNVESGHFSFFMLTGTSHWTNNWSVRDLRSHVVMLMWCHCNMKFYENLFHTTSLSDLPPHYSDVMTGAMVYQITSLTIVYSGVYSGADKKKHQSSASLAFVWGIHWWPVNSPQMASNAENVSIWSCHHELRSDQGLYSLNRCFYVYRNHHYKLQMVWRLSQLYNENPYPNVMVSS